MGKVNIVTKSYVQDAEIFADAFNYYIYGGQQVIDPAQLCSLDPAELGILHGNKGKIETKDLVEKYRDLLKMASLMMDQTAVYLLLGIENQAKIHYAMPVKNMSYDAQQYAGQVAATARKHRKEKDHAGHDDGEFLSGFYKEDRLIPVITLVVFFGAGRWDGPISLHEMMDVKDPKILSLVQDYKIHLIQPAALEQEDLLKFHSSLREVLSFIKYSQDKRKIAELMEKNKNFRALDKEAALVIGTCTNIKLEVKEELEVVDVCKAIDDMMADSREEGRAEERANTERERQEKERERQEKERERQEKEREKLRADLAEAEVRKLQEELERYRKGA